MNQIFNAIPLKARQEAANKVYNKKSVGIKGTHPEWAWPVCESDQCPWGVILDILYPGDLQRHLQPCPGYTLDVLNALDDETTTYEEVKKWMNQWDQGLISAEQLKKDLGV